MYKLATTNTNPTYQLRLRYSLTFPDGHVWETYYTKKAESLAPLSTKELRAISHVWLDDFLKATKRQHPNARLQVLSINVDTNLVVEQ